MSGDTTDYPPLLGDGQGKYRVLVLGNSGSGKSTVAVRLSTILGIPVFSLDRLFWRPNWIMTPREVFREQVAEALDATDGSWVVEGDYSRMLGTLVFDRTTDVIWLDPPFLLYIPRVIRRTFSRLFGWTEPCSPGCFENSSTLLRLDSENIIVYAIQNHWKKRRDNQARMDRIGLGVGTDVPNRRMRRIGGWGSELGGWLAGVSEMELVRKKL
ncbi:hypothetical protein BKA70DRAFT_1266198 [Coprinopsis sp. MPI-PUGE-AT-0042]|nr:hypothetical protein BKA70DRAFT_1266198 [Coprinopsis sp. MPI-PUGE-AT-0042]